MATDYDSSQMCEHPWMTMMMMMIAAKSSITKGQLVTAIFWFSGHTVKVSSNISQECTASTFRVT